MFIHSLKYSLKRLLKNRSLLFWTLGFPIFLAIFFDMAFSDIEKNEKLDIINIAIVNSEEFESNAYFKEAINYLSDKDNEEKLFNTKYTSESEAKKMLENEEIAGYIIINDETSVVVKSSGINETVIKSVVEEINTKSIIETDIVNDSISKSISSKTPINYNDIYNRVNEVLNNNGANIKDTSSKNLSYTMIEFYTLIAMSALYGGLIGMTSINENLPDMSNTGKRIAASPIKKSKIILSSIIASYIVELVGVFLLLIFTSVILNINYGSNLLLVVLLSSSGTLAGLSLGVAVGALLKRGENAKTGIILAVSMVGSFFAGMMGITMKYVIDTNIPIINIINPASMITDGFYSLYYYETMNRFIFNIVSLLVFSGIMFLLAFISLRRRKYDSI